MRRSLIFAAFALGAQTAWAQDTTEPAADPAVTEETAEAAEVAGGTEAEAAIVEGVADQTYVEEPDPDVVDEADPRMVDDTAEPPIETAEEEPTAEVTVGDGTDDGEASVEEEPVPVHADSRSATGAFRGGHHGTVSTLARAGLGPVFGKLRSQGYGDLQIEQVGDVIFVSGARDGEIRQLSYSASTGTLLEDTGQPRGLLEAIAGKLKGEPGADKARGKHKPSATSDAFKNGGKGRSKNGAQEGGNSKSGGGSKADGGSKAGGSKDGGNGGNGKGGGARKK